MFLFPGFNMELNDSNCDLRLFNPNVTKMMIQISHNTCPYHPSTEPVIKSYFYKIVVIFLTLWFC